MDPSQVRYLVVLGVTLSGESEHSYIQTEEGVKVYGKALTLEQAWGIAANYDGDRPIAIIPKG